MPGDEVGTAVGLATGVGNDEVGLGDAVGCPIVLGLAEGVAVEAVALGTGVGSDAVALGEAEGTGDAVTVALALATAVAFVRVGIGDAVAMEPPFAIAVGAVEAVGLATGVAARLPVATAGQDGDAARVTGRAVDGRCRTAPP